MILYLTFISTVSIYLHFMSCSSHVLLLTQPHRPTLDAYFHNPFYLSLVYMHPQCMIFNLNLMPPSQSKIGFSHTFQFFIFQEVKVLGPFSLLDEMNYLHFISIIGIIGNQWSTQTQFGNNGAPHHCLWTPINYNQHNSNNILLRQPQPGSKCPSECLGA